MELYLLEISVQKEISEPDLPIQQSRDPLYPLLQSQVFTLLQFPRPEQLFTASQVTIGKRQAYYRTMSSKYRMTARFHRKNRKSGLNVE